MQEKCIRSTQGTLWYVIYYHCAIIDLLFQFIKISHDIYGMYFDRIKKEKRKINTRDELNHSTIQNDIEFARCMKLNIFST